jgi:mannose-1-phosphate guanylyltransferase
MNPWQARSVDADAMILCAGLGTRLRPLSDEIPKPLMPVGDRPLLQHIAERLRAAGLLKPVVNLHHMSTHFFNRIREMPDNFKVVLEEPDILGTAGGVAHARELFAHDVLLLWNGDVLTNFPVLDLIEQARRTRGLCLAVRTRSAGQGTVGLNSEGRVVRLRGERFGREASGGDYLGVCALGLDCLRTLPARGCLIGEWALPVLRQGGTIHGLCVEPPYWFDIGEPSSYLRANLHWLGLAAPAPSGSWIGTGATLAPGVSASRSVVGSGAVVGGSGALHECVVWPDARASAPLTRAIVTPRTTLRVA